MLMIRADASSSIGAGHMMRCLTIARAYASEKAPVHFICANEKSAQLPREAGFPVHVLNTNPKDMKDELPVLLPLIEYALAKETRRKKSEGINVTSANSISSDAPLSSPVGVLLPEDTSREATVLLVDSYHVTDTYLSALSKIVPVFYMDDFGKHAYPVQGIINYNFYADKTVYETLYSDNLLRVSQNLSAGPEKTVSLTSDTASVPSPDRASHHQISAATPIFLLGPAYAPVREEFSNTSFAVSEKVRNVLILCGGGGDGSLPLRIYETLSKECDSGITWHIVLGKYAADNLSEDSLLHHLILQTAHHQTKSQASASDNDTCREKTCEPNATHTAPMLESEPSCTNASMNNNLSFISHSDSSKTPHLICHTNVKDMAALMIGCDLCLTAGGTTVYELCAVGLPFVTFSMADNQNENCRYLDTHGIADFAGSMETEPDRALANLSKSVQRLSADYSLRQEKSIQLKTLVDDGGARRIVAAMRGTW